MPSRGQIYPLEPPFTLERMKIAIGGVSSRSRLAACEEYTQQVEMLIPQSVASCGDLARERKRSKEIKREARN